MEASTTAYELVSCFSNGEILVTLGMVPAEWYGIFFPVLFLRQRWRFNMLGMFDR